MESDNPRQRMQALAAALQPVREWIAGAEVPAVGGLFSRLNLKTFDALVMQIRKEELLPQHWQVISAKSAPPDLEFDGLAEVGRLRLRHRDQEASRRRIDSSARTSACSRCSSFCSRCAKRPSSLSTSILRPTAIRSNASSSACAARAASWSCVV